ncbi:hypothetical protein HAY47_000470 [Salmonella enterica]|nr:hypothetical protein [Salmonella enterica]
MSKGNEREAKILVYASMQSLPGFNRDASHPHCLLALASLILKSFFL